MSGTNPLAASLGVDTEFAAPGELDAWLNGEYQIEAWPDKAKRQIASLESRVRALEVQVHQLLNAHQPVVFAEERAWQRLGVMAQRLLREAPLVAMSSLVTEDCREADEIQRWVGLVNIWREMLVDFGQGRIDEETEGAGESQ